MDNKYYTPEIEEFHVGFEFEMRVGDEWVPLLWNYQSYSLFDDEEYPLTLNKLRVKYLDREDIESLGFVFQEELPEKFEFTRTFYQYKGKYNLFFVKHKLGDDHHHQITITEPESKLFKGKIKNKSELKKILSQINLDN